MDTQSLPGFRDFYPEECAVRDLIFGAWRASAESYGFRAYDGPPLESLELYKKKSGDEIVGQLYHFKDKGDREVALRPEMTPSLARMIGARGRALPRPMKWYSIPQLFRYERQQKGRLREHFQFNCDIIGEAGVAADAELVALLIDSLCRLGLGAEDFVVRVNDRKLLVALIEKAGVKPEKLPGTLGIVDKITREPKAAVEKRLAEHLGDQGVAARVIQIFEIKTLADLESRSGGDAALAARLLEFQRFFGLLEAMGLGAFVRFDPGIVRGLLYYTGIVYEVFDLQGEFRAVAGGGRYDQLMQAIGGVDLPAAGFGMGDVVLGELLKARGKLPQPKHPLDVFLVVVDGALMTRAALPMARELRQSGLSVEYPFEPGGVSKQFKHAAQRGARFAVVVGPEEWGRQAVKVKNMQTGVETEVKVGELQAFLRENA